MLYVSIDMLQSMPTNNVCRGKYGEVKSIDIGGSIRQRVPSAPFKRNGRLALRDFCKDNGDAFGIFSRVHGTEIKNRLEAEGIVIDNLLDILADLGLGTIDEIKETDKAPTNVDTSDSDDNEDANDVVMYLSSDELNIIYNTIKEGTVYKKVKSRDDKDKKSKKKPKSIKGALTAILKDAKCRSPYEIAVCGRMLASNTEMQIHSALRMSHAISTHAIIKENDFFTAVDDLNTVGSAHMGNFECTSSTIYRYFMVDLDQYATNVKGAVDYEFIRAVIKTFVLAFPSGKTTTMNADTLPSYVGFTVGNGFPKQCHAFERPIEASSEGFDAPSIRRLKEYRDNRIKSNLMNIKLSTEWEFDLGMNFDTVLDTVMNTIKNK